MRTKELRVLARKSLLVVLILGEVLLVACSGGGKASGSRAGGALQIKGSDTMVNLGQAWAEAFNKLHPEINVAVTGGGSGTGIAAILNGDLRHRRIVPGA